MDIPQSDIRLGSEIHQRDDHQKEITKEEVIMSTKNGSTNAIALTAQALAEELMIDLADFLPLLTKMGVKNAAADSVVPEATAKNARLAVAARNNIIASKPLALSAGEELRGGKSTPDQQSRQQPQQQEANQVNTSEEGAIEVHRKMKLAEIKDVAQATGLSQSVIKKFDQLLHDRECQLAFLEGYQRSLRKKQLEAALNTGAIAADLEEIQRKEQELDERENLLIEQGTSVDNHPVNLAKSMGIDLDGMLAKLQESEEKKASDRLSQEQTGVATEGLNPFQRLAQKKKG
jgi:hypothetical protein